MRGRCSWLGLSGALLWACAEAPTPHEAPRAVDLLHTADTHSRLWPYRSRISSFEAQLGLGDPNELTELGGVARLATRLAEERRRGPTLWLDSGDALEGAEIFHRTGGSLELELLSELGLGAMGLGNHELSLSAPALAALLAGSARFPVLSANLVPTADSPLDGWLQPSVVLGVEGLRVGVIGIANPTSPPELKAAHNSWGLVAAPLAGALQLALDELAPRADLLVVLSHVGLEQDRELVAATTGIDLVLGGHQHIVSAEPDWQDDCQSLAAERACSPRRVPIVHSGAYARWLSRLQLALELDPAGGVEIADLQLQQLPLNAEVAPEPSVAERLEAEQLEPEPPLAFLPEPVARRAALGGDAPLGDWVTEALLAAFGADVVLLNSSGLRADLEAGELLRSDLELAFPFDEPWRLALVDLASLRRGLLRAARRSAGQDCTSVLQVAGLQLRLRCGSCRTGADDCLEVVRLGAWEGRRLGDSERLRLALPRYLTLAGADFEELGEQGAQVDGAIAPRLAEALSGLPRVRDLTACASALERSSASRCREAFGAWACPLAADVAEHVCRGLPQLEVERDERIEMLP
jgi:5'-nucleotidase